uniref:Uncharacterized protein n=1 Tax=Onchocerca volvulus TaxID=6282 RepID=A0A8R1TXV1_ONCVO
MNKSPVAQINNSRMDGSPKEHNLPSRNHLIKAVAQKRDFQHCSIIHARWRWKRPEVSEGIVCIEAWTAQHR